MAAEEFLGTEERCFSCLHNGVLSFPGMVAATKEKCELPVVPVLTHARPASIPGTTQTPKHGGLQRDSNFRAWDLGTENPVPTLWQGVKVVYIPRRAQNDSMAQDWGGQLQPQPQPGRDLGGQGLCTKSQNQTPQQLWVSSKIGQNHELSCPA